MICQACGALQQPDRHAWLWRCTGCGVLRSTFAVEIPADAVTGGLDETLRAEGLEAVRTKNNAAILDAISAHTAQRRLLDVGCGPGFLLTQAHALGFEVTGVEPDGNTVEAGRRRGAAVRHGYFPAALSPDDVYDVIIFNDVLEHIPDLADALAASFRHLASGGLLCVNCPDRRGLFFRVADLFDRLGIHGPYDRLWQRSLPSPHVWYFTPGNLSTAATGAGFAPAGFLRLDVISVAGLWSRIRYVRDQSLALSLAAFVFALASLPLARILPSDTSVSIFRKPTIL